MTRTMALIGGGLLAVSLGIVILPGGSPAHAAPLSAPAAAQARRLTGVDWMNRTYTTACFSSNPRPFVAHNGAAQTGGVHYQVYAPLYGDLTGDGQPEAIIPYSCTGADFGGVHAFVYGGTAAAPRLLGDLPSSAVGGQALSSIHTVTLPALALLPRERVLQVSGSGYSANAAHSCPDLRVTMSYRVADGRLAPTGSTVQRASGCLSL